MKIVSKLSHPNAAPFAKVAPTNPLKSKFVHRDIVRLYCAKYSIFDHTRKGNADLKVSKASMLCFPPAL